MERKDVVTKPQLKHDIDEEIKKLFKNINDSYAKTGDSHEVDRAIWLEKINVLSATKKCLNNEEVNMSDVIRQNPRYQQKWTLTSGWHDSTGSTTEDFLNKALNLVQYDRRAIDLIKKIQTQINKLDADIQKYSSDKIKNKEHLAVWGDKKYVLEKIALAVATPRVDPEAAIRERPRYNQQYSSFSGWYESKDSTTESLITEAAEIIEKPDHGKKHSNSK
jgi:hypothetical protein